MPAYCAFLRGVNVNGRTMKMAEACQVFREAGMEQVSNVLATGNIIFQSTDDEKDGLRRGLEAALNQHFNMESRLFIKDAAEIQALLDAVPFSSDPQWHIYAFICDAGFERTLEDEFQALTAVEGDKPAATLGEPGGPGGPFSAGGPGEPREASSTGGPGGPSSAGGPGESSNAGEPREPGGPSGAGEAFLSSKASEYAVVSKGYFFWRVQKGATLSTPFSKILGRERFKEHFTSRNINTMEKVRDKML